MSRIRYLDIDELNDRLKELEDIKDNLRIAEEALAEYDEEHNPPEDSDDERQDLIEKVESAQEEFDDIARELASLEEFKDEVGESRGKISEDGGPFVHCDDFEDYAQQFADDIGAIDHKAGWPLNCIDWTQAAKELSADYSIITYRGTDYYYRS